MQKIIVYDINEIFALIIAVIMGTGAYIGFMVLKKQKKVSISFIIIVLFINTLVTYVASGILKKTSMGEYRTIVLPIIAYLGQYVMEWVDKRFLKLFDAGAKKMGLNLDNTDDELEQNNIQDETKS